MKLVRLPGGWQAVNCLDDGPHELARRYTREFKDRFQSTFWYQCIDCGLEVSGLGDPQALFENTIIDHESKVHQWFKAARKRIPL